MFNIVESWVHKRPDRGSSLNDILSSESVKAGRNHHVQNMQESFTGIQQLAQSQGMNLGSGTSSHSATSGGVFDMLNRRREIGADTVGPDTYSHPPAPAAYDQSSQTYPTAYQQGYEAPWQPQQQQQQGYGQQQGYEGGYQQQSYQGGGSGYGGGYDNQPRY